MPVKKLYCYVDENGQDTKGKVFIVSVVVTGTERDELLQVCEEFEIKSGKGRVKWRKSSYKSRVAYMSLLLSDKRFKGKLRYEVFKETKLYDTATIEGIAHAIKWRKPSEQFTTLIYVDGLAKTKRHDYGAMLRHLGIPIHKVQGVAKDENNALIRKKPPTKGWRNLDLGFLLKQLAIRSVFGSYLTYLYHILVAFVKLYFGY